MIPSQNTVIIIYFLTLRAFILLGFNVSFSFTIEELNDRTHMIMAKKKNAWDVIFKTLD